MSERPPRSRSEPVEGAAPGAGPTGSSARPSAPADSRIRAVLWTTIPAALATELGALVMIVAGALAGVVASLLAVIVLHLALRSLVPGSAVVRAALLVGGPPLRYALVIAAVWFEWVARSSGPGPALAGGVLLAFVVPMIGGVLANPRSGARRR